MKKTYISFLLAGLAITFYACDSKQGDSTVATDTTATSTSVADTASTSTYAVDTTESSIKWTGKKVTGQHNGTIQIQDGQLQARAEVLTDGDIVIDMASMRNEDLKDEESNQKLIGHLKSDDFFSVEKYPTAKFDVTRIDPGTDGNSIITGDLTIKDKTEEISIPAEVKFDGDQIKAEGKTTIDRTKWDVRYGSGKFFEGLGDKMIYDEIELEFDLVANKQ